MKINLFCLPFAGGSKYSYNKFVDMAPPSMEVIAIELPGRGSRFRENLLYEANLVVLDVFNQIKAKLETPYAIYGHSMGSLIGYLLAEKIKAEGLPEPIGLFFSGRGGPTIPRENDFNYLLPKDLFVAKLKELNGTPDEVLDNEGLIAFFEPIIRADFQCIETYEYKLGELLSIPIFIFIGVHERTTYKEALAWKDVTTGEVSIQQFPGKHFFIFEFTADLLEMIAEKLKKITGQKNSKVSSKNF